MDLLFFLLSLILPPVLAWALFPAALRLGGALVGHYLVRSARTRRELLLARSAAEQQTWESESKSKDGEDSGSSAANRSKADENWNGIVGFFHPFCNAGGGGERVLWAAIRATQDHWPGALCVVYTGDHIDKSDILKRVKDRFNIHLHSPTVHFLYLSTRDYVLANRYPHFTLLGQSLGSLRLAYDAFTLLPPDIFVDTMGYAFAVSMCKLFFPTVPTGAYVHYPTISTDMLQSLDSGGKGVHVGAGAGYRGVLKKAYWQAFAKLYSFVGSTIDVVMTNSTWTQAHIKSLWGPYRRKRTHADAATNDISVVFPPVAVEEVEIEVPISAASEDDRRPYILYIAQFRPEKNHKLILEAFASFAHSARSAEHPHHHHHQFPAYPAGVAPKLILIGSVRDDEDKKRVYELRLLANELQVKDSVEFVCDAAWSHMLQWMRVASVGVNGMWNEHFGIGVVEYQAAGLISVVNDSGGPKLDIVVDVDGRPTGYHATTAADYAAGFHKALSLPRSDTSAMRQRARQSAARFTDRVFADQWIRNMELLVRLQILWAKKS